MDRCAEDVEIFLKSASNVDFMRHASLFYKANVNYLTSVDRELFRADPDDHLGFVPRTSRDLRIGKGIVQPLIESSHDIQVHIHHEYYTYNDTPRDPDTFAYLQTPRGRSFDNARLELAIRLGLDTIREDGGVTVDQWFFIHGHWALNASDPHECNVVREIEILKRNGCLGDFTQPAGRLHVDSRIGVPYLVDPVAAPKGYDTPAARPAEAAGAGANAADRFFIWASEATHRTCSIDTYSTVVKQRLKTPEATALDHAQSSVVIAGVLYLKTHCHSMHPIYWKPDGLPLPHSDPAVQLELRTFFNVADRNGIDVKFLSVSEVYDSVIGASAAKPRDLVREYDLDQGVAMEPIGMTVEFRDGGGNSVPPPPLGARPENFPTPSIVDGTSSGRSRAVMGPEDSVVAQIVPLERRVLATDGPSDLDATASLLNAQAEVPDLMAARDVAKLNAQACSLAIDLAEQLGAEASGVTGFYGPRAKQRELLQPAEVLCAHFVQSRLPNVRSVYEIGCGLGLLSALLAMRGVDAIGVERNRARLTTAMAIAEKVAGRGTGPRWVRGVFPNVLRRERNLASSVALVTNLLGSATSEQQSSFILGLRSFGAVLIDAQRFYERRVTRNQIDGLKSKFAEAGFEKPRLAFDLGPDGHFLLFINPSPKRRWGLEALSAKLGFAGSKPLVVTE